MNNGFISVVYLHHATRKQIPRKFYSFIFVSRERKGRLFLVRLLNIFWAIDVCIMLNKVGQTNKAYKICADGGWLKFDH
jgi:hypothetical protein